MSEYAVIIEQGPDGGFGAYVPDLPGCVAVGATRREVQRLINEAVIAHLISLRESGERIPAPSSATSRVTVADPPPG